MSYTDKQEELLRSLDYVDPEMIAGAVARIDEKKSRVKAVKKNKVNLYFKLAAAVAACLAIIAIAWPTSVLITEYYEYTPPFFGAANSGAQIETMPEYDGSRGLLYEVNEDGTEATFIGYGSCTDETVYIASTYDGLPVTRMYNKSYADATYHAADNYFGSQYVKKLVISDTVREIDNECLRECPNLESVYFGAGIEKLMPLFNHRSGKDLLSIEVSPDNPYYAVIGNSLVDTRTKTLVIATVNTVIPCDGSVEIIGRSAFSWTRSIKSLVIPEGVKIIEHSAFSGCQSLESILIADSVEVIDSDAFIGCSNLKNVELGTGLKVFHNFAFHYLCGSLYGTKIYYKGTVEQWESVIKTFRDEDDIRSYAIRCSDGESLSSAGSLRWKNWWFAPEYQWYWERKYPGIPFPDQGPNWTGLPEDLE